MGGNHHFDPHSYENFGWQTPIEELPVYKGSIRRPLNPSANWRYTGIKPEGFTDVASEVKANYQYNVSWRSLDVWNFKNKYSGYQRRIFSKFLGLSIAAYLIGTYGMFTRNRVSAGYERTRSRDPLSTGFGTIFESRQATNTIVKDVRFSERFGRTTVSKLNKQGIELQ